MCERVQICEKYLDGKGVTDITGILTLGKSQIHSSIPDMEETQMKGILNGDALDV